MNYYLWLLAGLVVASIGLVVRRRQTVVGTGLAAVGAAAAIGVIGWQVRGLLFGTGATPPVDRQRAVVAYFMGYEVLGEIGSRNGAVALLLPPDTRANQAELDSLFNTFARVLTPVPGLQLVDVSLAADERRIQAGDVSPGTFNAALDGLTNLAACVSFVGIPRETEQLAILRAKPPVPLFVYDPSGGTNWLAALETGAIRRVILPRRGVTGDDLPDRGAPDELFRRHFLLARPANAGAIARELQGPGTE